MTEKMFKAFRLIGTLPPAPQRREILVKQMTVLEEKGIHCHSCRTGKCCTFTSNSMQITPLEAMDLYQGLLSPQGEFPLDVLATLEKTIEDYRLQVDFHGQGRKNPLRKTYTCPFFRGTSAGCSLSRQIKPYGCLGFNPIEEVREEGENCRSDGDLLQERQKTFGREEIQVNEDLRKGLSLDWEKLAIPRALVEIHRALQK